MKFLTRSKLVLALTTAGTLLLSHNVSADYRVTAFGEATAYNALMSADAETAKSIFARKSVAKLDFTALNNLCVTQILSSEYTAAIATCKSALEDVETDLTIPSATEKAAKADILSNMAVAKVMSGDLAGAVTDIELAASLDGYDRNVSSNYELISAKRLPVEIASGI